MDKTKGMLGGALLAIVVMMGLSIASMIGAQRADSIELCATEDAPGPCIWIAEIQGNGVGQSFIVSELGIVTYLGENR